MYQWVKWCGWVVSMCVGVWGVCVWAGCVGM